MVAATHSGHCQACGSLQKLPKGRLSLHGYKILGGFFSGVCRGAKHEPFEVSCTLIETFIAEAKIALKGVQAEQAYWRRATDPADVMIHHFVGSRKGLSSYEWVRVALRVADDAEGRHEYYYMARKAGGKWDFETGTWQLAEHGITDYDYGRKPVAEFVAGKNTEYAKWLQHQVDGLTRYIAWQKDRIKNWKPAPLLPVTTKNDKQEFKPTEPAY